MAYKIVSTSDFNATTPASNDVMVLDVRPGPDVVTNVDQNGDDYDALILPIGYQRSCAVTGSPIIAAADMIKHFGSGNLFFECHNGGAAVKTDAVRIQCENNEAITELGSTAGNKGDYDQIFISRGNVLLKGTIAFGATAIVETGFEANRAQDVRLEIVAGAETLPTLIVNGGQVFTHNTITNMRVAGAGTLVTIDTTHVTGTIEIYSGAKVILDDEAVTGDGTIIKVYSGGTLDLMHNSNQKTINTLWRFPGSRVIFDDNMHAFTTEHDLTKLRS